MERDEDTIDLGKLFGIMMDKKKVVGSIVGGCTVLAMVVSFMLPKEYTSNVLVQTSSGEMGIGGAAAAMAALTGSGAGGKATTYIELMKTRTVLDPIIAQVFDDIEEDKRLNAEGFAKKNLDIINTKGTNLISINAKGRTPEEAHYIAENVVSNFLSLMTETNQGGKSEVMKFLNNRVDIAKKEVDEAALNLEEFSKEHKMYQPTEQVTDMLRRTMAYDKTISELEVKKQAEQAQLDSLSSQIGEQDNSARSYNIAENDMVRSLRNKIVEKELSLVSMRQNYQEEHPSVIRAKEDLEELNNKLTREVATVIASNVTAVNDMQAEMIERKYQAEAALAVANASEEKIRQLQAEKEGDVQKMADDAREYAKLARENGIKQEVYTNLVKQAEQTKIQQTMESMDIQIVDPASMPEEDKPTGPRKKLITAIGFVLGCMLSFGYSLVIYKKSPL